MEQKRLINLNYDQAVFQKNKFPDDIQRGSCCAPVQYQKGISRFFQVAKCFSPL